MNIYRVIEEDFLTKGMVKEGDLVEGDLTVEKRGEKFLVSCVKVLKNNKRVWLHTSSLKQLTFVDLWEMKRNNEFI